MKPGVRPLVLDGCTMVPEYPAYWAVPTSFGGAIDLLVRDGQVEYEPEFKPSAAGVLTEQLGVQTVAVSSKPFARKKV
jgi:hypothetical protein